MSALAPERPTIEEELVTPDQRLIDTLREDFDTNDLGIFPEEDTQSQDKEIFSSRDHLFQKIGGKEEEWSPDETAIRKSDSFDGNELFGYRNGEKYSITKEINETCTPEIIAEHQTFLEYLKSDSKEGFIFSWTEGDETKARIARKDENGEVDYEPWVWRGEKKEEEENEPEDVESGLDYDVPATEIDSEYEAEESQLVVTAERVEEQALAEAIAELFAEDELETEEEQVNDVAAIAKTTVATQPVVSIAERMERVAVLFAEPEQSLKPDPKSESKPDSKQDEASLKILETVELSADISSSVPSPEITSTVQDELQTEVSSKIKVEAQVAEKSISEIEAGSPTIVLREVTEESTLIPTSEKEDIVVVFEVENVAEVVNVPLPEIVSEIQEVVADVVEKTNDEIVVPIKDLDISSDTPFLETSVTDIRSEENANQTRIENLVDSNSELATEAAFEVIMDKIVTESVIDTPVITTTREVIHKETTTEITSEDSKEQVSETIKTSEIKEVVALPIKETLAPAKKVEPIGIKIVRIEAGEIARADSPIEARARVETLEAEATLKGNVLQREILTTQSPESFSRRQYLSYIFPEDIQVTSALREVPANDNREVTESRATVAARNGIIMRLVA
jgi:DNA-binding PadR family transcriptional regulator